MNLFRRKSVTALQAQAAGDQSLKRVLGPLNLTLLGIGWTVKEAVSTRSMSGARLVCTALVVSYGAFIVWVGGDWMLAGRFIAHVLARNIRIEEDLLDQLFNSNEKRLARTLLLLARYGKQDRPERVVPRISQDLLAQIVGTTRSRVNFFLSRFRKLGFIEYDNGHFEVNSSLLSVVLRE